MSEILVKGLPFGGKSNAVTSATTVRVDLRAHVGSYIKMWADQNFLFGFGSSNSAEFASTVGTVLISASSGAAPYPRPVASGYSGVQRQITAQYPYLLLRAVSTTAAIEYEITSDPLPNRGQ